MGLFVQHYTHTYCKFENNNKQFFFFTNVHCGWHYLEVACSNFVIVFITLSIIMHGCKIKTFNL